MIVLSILGTRPEAIKMAPVIRELARHPASVESVTCVTGQHRELVQPVLDLFEIEPDHSLSVMSPGQSLSQLTASLLEGLDVVLDAVRPDWVLAQGDTTSVLAAGLAAHFHRARFGHVEAGLRTGDAGRPFPEELNRRMADVAADALFVPTDGARTHLLREGFDPSRIHLTGNTVVDALLDIAERPFAWETSPLAALIQDRRFVLVTAHRRESFGGPLREILEAVRDLALRFKNAGVQFVFPVHLNPNVRGPAQDILSGLCNVSLIDPVDYLSMVQLMKRASLILTDSGGIQEEAPTFGVPVVVMRETTERPEGLALGSVHMAGTSRHRIVSMAAAVLASADTHRDHTARANPYGDGHAAERIVSVLLAGPSARHRTPAPACGTEPGVAAPSP